MRIRLELAYALSKVMAAGLILVSACTVSSGDGVEDDDDDNNFAGTGATRASGGSGGSRMNDDAGSGGTDVDNTGGSRADDDGGTAGEEEEEDDETGGTGGEDEEEETGGTGGEDEEEETGGTGGEDEEDACEEAIGPVPDCDDLHYATSDCDGEFPDGLTFCRIWEGRARDGAFEEFFECLDAIDVGACSNGHRDAANVCANDLLDGECRTSYDACVAMGSGICNEATDDGTEDQKSTCSHYLDVLDEDHQTQALKCMMDGTFAGTEYEDDCVARLSDSCALLDQCEDYEDDVASMKSCDDLPNALDDYAWCDNDEDGEYDEGDDDTLDVQTCRVVDEGWARGPWFDQFHSCLEEIESEDPCSEEHEAAVGDCWFEMRNHACPTSTGADICEEISESCDGVNLHRCMLSLDFLNEDSQEQVVACMDAEGGDCEEAFSNCVLGD